MNEAKKGILLVSYYWPPSGGSSVQRWLKMLKYFPEMKIEPFVITVDPSLASYPLIDKTLENEVHPDIQVYRTKTKEFYNVYKKISGKKEIPYGGFVNEEKIDFRQIISRIIRSHFFIPDPRRGWNRFAYKKAVELIKKHNIKTVITASPPHSTQLIGLKLKKLFDICWIADLQDPWTDIYYYNQLFHSFISASIDAYYERKVLINADYIITVSQSIKEIFSSKSKKINPQIIHVIPNGYDEDDFKTPAETKNNYFLITYTGTINDDYYPVDSFLKTLEKTATKGFKICLRFVGKVSPAARQKIMNTNGIKYEFIDYVPHQESLKYLMQANALLLIIPNIQQNEGILTGKLFEYLGSGKRIIGIGPSHGDAAKIINECNSGKMFDYNNLTGIEKYLEEIIRNKQFIPDWEKISRYSRKSQANEIAKLIRY
jgi:glycosyltransferase involved in cell wall biosynthesis